MVNIMSSVVKGAGYRTYDNNCICYEAVKQTDKIEAACGHIFHEKCLKSWFAACDVKQLEHTCPICREIVVLAPMEPYPGGKGVFILKKNGLEPPLNPWHYGGDGYIEFSSTTPDSLFNEIDFVFNSDGSLKNIFMVCDQVKFLIVEPFLRVSLQQDVMFEWSLEPYFKVETEGRYSKEVFIRAFDILMTNNEFPEEYLKLLRDSVDRLR